MKYIKQRDELIELGRLMWDKGLVCGYNGNISVRADDAHILMTASGTCLGRLTREDIVLVTEKGVVIGGGKPTSEWLLHVDIYRSLPKVMAVVHTHTPCINAFFLNKEVFHPATLEAEYVLGDVHGIAQDTINVADTAPVIERLRSGKLVALRRHGVVAAGANLFDCFTRIQVLEEQLWTEALGKIFKV
jgi:L-fuculose-phosphate aldolase